MSASVSDSKELERLRALEVVVLPEDFAPSVVEWARGVLSRTPGGRKQLERIDGAYRALAREENR
jgi:hypothetical protein